MTPWNRSVPGCCSVGANIVAASASVVGNLISGAVRADPGVCAGENPGGEAVGVCCVLGMCGWCVGAGTLGSGCACVKRVCHGVLVGTGVGVSIGVGICHDPVACVFGVLSLVGCVKKGFSMVMCSLICCI